MISKATPAGVREEGSRYIGNKIILSFRIHRTTNSVGRGNGYELMRNPPCQKNIIFWKPDLVEQLGIKQAPG